MRLQREYHELYRRPYTLYTAVSTATLCTIVSGSAGGLVGGFAGGLQDPIVVRLQREYHRRYSCPYTLYTTVSTATLCTPYTPYTAVSTATLCTIVSGRSAGGLVGGFAGGLQDPVVVARDVGVVAVLVLAVAAHAPRYDAHQHEAARVLHDVRAAAVARAGVAPHAA